jgi:hypothetical protein
MHPVPPAAQIPAHRNVPDCCQCVAKQRTKNVTEPGKPPTEVVNGHWCYGVISKTPVNSREYTINSVNFTYLHSSGVFGLEALFPGHFWHWKGLGYL